MLIWTNICKHAAIKRAPTTKANHLSDASSKNENRREASAVPNTCLHFTNKNSFF